MRLYYLLGQLLRPVLGVGFFMYCVITGTSRVRIIAKNELDEILLVKTWLSTDEWEFPGGGVERGESLEDAACRELREETGIRIAPAKLDKLGTVRSWRHDEVIFQVQLPRGALTGELPSRFEIKDAAWFSGSNMPKIGSLAKKIVQKW